MEDCPLCQGGVKPVKDTGIQIVCPMCNGEGEVTKDDIQAFFKKLMERKGVKVVDKRNKVWR